MDGLLPVAVTVGMGPFRGRLPALGGAVSCREKSWCVGKGSSSLSFQNGNCSPTSNDLLSLSLFPPSVCLPVSLSRAFFSSSDSVANCAAVQEGALVYLLRRKSVLFIVHRCEVPVKVRGARGRPGSDFSSVSVHLHTCPPSRRVYCCCPMLSDVFFFFFLNCCFSFKVR